MASPPYLLFPFLLCITGVSFRQQGKGFPHGRSLEAWMELFFVTKMPEPLNALQVKCVFAQFLCPSALPASLALFCSGWLCLFSCWQRTDSFLPSQCCAPLRAWVQPRKGLKRANCSCEKNLLSCQGSLSLPPPMPPSSGELPPWEPWAEAEPFLCTLWSWSCSAGPQVPQTLCCLPCSSLSHNLTWS